MKEVPPEPLEPPLAKPLLVPTDDGSTESDHVFSY